MATCSGDGWTYIHMHKTGGTWGYRALGRAGLVLRTHKTHGVARDTPLQSFVFGSIRPPVDWYSSCYFYLKNGPGRWLDPYIKAAGNSDPEPVIFAMLHAGEHISDFGSNDSLYSHHVKRYFFDRAGRNLLDAAFITERAQEGLIEIGTKRGFICLRNQAAIKRQERVVVTEKVGWEMGAELRQQIAKKDRWVIDLFDLDSGNAAWWRD